MRRRSFGGGAFVCPATPAATVADDPGAGFLGKDESRYPDFFATSGMGGLGTFQHVCVRPIKYIGRAVMQRDVDSFPAALKGAHVEGAFLPVVSPTSISVDHKNEYYASQEEYLAALADALNVWASCGSKR